MPISNARDCHIAKSDQPVCTRRIARVGAATLAGFAFIASSVAQERMQAPPQPSAPASQVPVQAPGSAALRLQRLRSTPAPVNLKIEPQNPGLHKLSWEAPPGASQFRVLRRTGSATTWNLLADGITGTQYLDRSIVSPSATYRIESIQPNMIAGGAEISYLNPPRPEPPRQFSAYQDTTGKLTLRWTVAPGVTGHRLFGPGIAQTGLLFNTSPESRKDGGYGIVHEIREPPVGTFTYSIASVFGDAGYVAESMSSVSVTTTVRKGRYRITVNGFRCNRATNDDPILHRDGKGDEVFVAVFVGTDLTEARRIDRKIVRSRVYGDINNFPDRIQAGTSSPTGGIGPGNPVPLTAGVTMLPVSPTTDRLPLLVWEGELWDGDFGMAVVPTVWEWDGDEKNYQSWSGWLMGARYDWLDVLRKELKPEPLRWYGIGPTIYADNIGVPIDDSFGKDLPIGYRNIGMVSLSSSDKPAFASKAYLMSRTNIERLLGNNQTAMLSMSWTALGGVGGEYDVFLQIERLP
jgi:hypothetical protein